MTTQLWLWIGFNVFALAMLALVLGLFHRKAHAVGFKEGRAADENPCFPAGHQAHQPISSFLFRPVER